MMRKSTKPSAQKTFIAAGKRAAEEAKVFVGEVADAAAAAAATTKAMAGVILDKVATAIEARAAKGANRLLLKSPLRMRRARNPVSERRRRSLKERLLRSALHQARSPTQRRGAARLQRRNVLKRAPLAPGEDPQPVQRIPGVKSRAS
jgi:hypothetical protein